MNPGFRPSLRPLDIVPCHWEGKPSLVLRDPLGYFQGFLVLPHRLAPLLALMDGTNDLRDLQAAATRIFGRLVMLEEVADLVKRLATCGFLDGEDFERLRSEAEKSWKALSVRPPSHAGQAYPQDSQELRRFLKDLLSQAEPSRSFPPQILIAPHLDLSSGAKGYAVAYGNLDLPPGARVILVGTGHHLEKPFSVLTKDLETPLGILPVDQKFLERLETRGLPLYPDEFAHRQEHSLEFQALFLRHLFSEIKVVPVLMGSVEAVLREGKDPLQALLDLYRLAKALRDFWDERTYMVLGIDFAHLGARYGDAWPAGEKEGDLAVARDKALLSALFSGNYEVFLDEARKSLSFRVCGLSALFLVAGLLRGESPQGEIYYQEAVPFGPGSLVSIAAAGMRF